MRLTRLLAVAATLAAGLVAGATVPASACGDSDTQTTGSRYWDDAYTCRYRSGMGTLGNYTSTKDMPANVLYHSVVFENFSGRDIHLGFYRQGIRHGDYVSTTLATNALVSKGKLRRFTREFSEWSYQNIRGVVKHHGTDRYIYTPWINLEQCTGPGGNC